MFECLKSETVFFKNPPPVSTFFLQVSLIMAYELKDSKGDPVKHNEIAAHVVVFGSDLSLKNSLK